jgi:hypothetical protein
MVYFYLQLQLTNVIDSTWSIAVERADEAGRELAKALIKRAEEGTDDRPVTLVGFSVGARVIVSCLKEIVGLIAKCTSKRKGVRDEEDEAATHERSSSSSAPNESGKASSEKEMDQIALSPSTVVKLRALLQDVILLGAPVNIKVVCRWL